MAESQLDSWMKILNPDVTSRVGFIKHALFDFDGTLSVLREGWEKYMIPVMLEAICGTHVATPEIEQEVREYVDKSTGILTILQMQWLVEKVKSYGLVNTPLTAQEYKQIYLNRLMKNVDKRISLVEEGVIATDDMLVQGTRAFLTGLYSRGVILYLISGTDHEYVLREARVVNIDKFFIGGIYGALDEIEAHSKDRIIQRILNEHKLSGNGLLVVGDGPVEIREANSRGAIALGVASNEINRSGWNESKIRRLTDAGSHILIPDFTNSEFLLSFLFHE